MLAVTVHPGGADTELGRHIGMAKFLQPLLRPFLNSALQGAWPTLMGATWPEAQPNHYYGPSGLGELTGPAKIVKGNASFRVLLDSATQVDVAADATSETTAAIRVAAQPEHPNAPASFVFDLSCEEASGQWQTDGVRIEC